MAKTWHIIFRLISILFLYGALTSCDSAVIKEAKSAENDGRLISNEMMAQMYPRSFKNGNPQYLERDFEAGANFICDELKERHKRDVCAEELNWR